MDRLRPGKPELFRIFAVWVAALLMAGALFADGRSELQCDFSACKKITGNSIVGRCMKKVASDFDATIERVYQRMKAVVEKHDEDSGSSVYAAWPSFEEAHKTWIIYRSETCSGETMLWQGGSHSPLAHAGCMCREAEIRLRTMKQIIDGYSD